MKRRSGGGGIVSHAVIYRQTEAARPAAPGERRLGVARSRGGLMRRDGTERRVACGPLSGSFNQNITRSADDGGRGHSRTRSSRSVGRSVVASFVGSLRAHRQSAGGSVCHGLPRSHFVCSCRLDGGGAPAKTTTCVVLLFLLSPLSLPPRPAPLPSSFLAQNERWIAVFSRADERSTKRGRERGRDMAKSRQRMLSWYT